MDVSLERIGSLFSMSLVMGALSIAGAGCANRPGEPPVIMGAPSARAGVPVAFRAVALTGRHEVQSAMLGPLGRAYVATMDELFIFSPDDPSAGERVPFHGVLVSTPSGSRLYAIDGPTLVELDPSGAEVRKVAFGRAIESLAFSRSGGLLRVLLRDETGLPTMAVLRAGDLGVIATQQHVRAKAEVAASHDDVYAVVGDRVIDTRTGAIAYMREGLDRLPLIFEGHRLFALGRERLAIVDLEAGTARELTLPCSARGRLAPAEHRFLTHCDAETIVTNVSGEAPTFEHLAPGMYVLPRTETARQAAKPLRIPAPARFAMGVVGRVLLLGSGTALRDGELLVPDSAAAGTFAARIRIAPPSGRPPVGQPPRAEPAWGITSEDGTVTIGMTTATYARPWTTLLRLDARSGNVVSTTKLSDPSSRSPRLLGLSLDRLVVMPDSGYWAHVILLDARTFEEKERYFFGKDSMLHVREDGTYETTGNAALLENLLVCTDGRRFVNVARCAAKR